MSHHSRLLLLSIPRSQASCKARAKIKAGSKGGKELLLGSELCQHAHGHKREHETQGTFCCIVLFPLSVLTIFKPHYRWHGCVLTYCVICIWVCFRLCHSLGKCCAVCAQDTEFCRKLQACTLACALLQSLRFGAQDLGVVEVVYPMRSSLMSVFGVSISVFGVSLFLLSYHSLYIASASINSFLHSSGSVNAV